jgi:hypothetical protein
MFGTWIFIGWYYDRNGQRIGPVRTEEIGRLVQNGELQASDLVWKGWREGEETHFLRSRAGVALGLWNQ